MPIERTLPESDKFASCPQEGKILSYYADHFEAVFIVLHPFLKPKSNKATDFKSISKKDNWLNDSQILEWCTPVTWTEFLKASKIANLQNLDGALRNSIFGLKDRERFQTDTNTLVSTLDLEGLIPPDEGEIPCILLPRIRQALHSLDYEWVWLGDEFCTERKLEWIDDLDTTDKIPCHGCIFTPDRQVLLVSHWDSHCTFLCSSRKKITQFVKEAKLEGVYCTPQTEVYWGLCEI